MLNEKDLYIHDGKVNGVNYSLYGKDIVDYSIPYEIIFHNDDDQDLVDLLNYYKRKGDVEAAHRYLEETDYVACKLAEGVATKEQYSEVLKKRQQARDIINEYEDS